MVDWDDLQPKPKRTIVVGEDLTSTSIAELGERIEALEAEIARTRAEIARKQAHGSAAQGLFKR